MEQFIIILLILLIVVCCNKSNMEGMINYNNFNLFRKKYNDFNKIITSECCENDSNCDKKPLFLSDPNCKNNLEKAESELNSFYDPIAINLNQEVNDFYKNLEDNKELLEEIKTNNISKRNINIINNIVLPYPYNIPGQENNIYSNI